MLKHHTAHASRPILLIHGGAGNYDGQQEQLQQRRTYLQALVDQLWPDLQAGQSASETVYKAVYTLEASALFNAGHGAALQRDGQARLSASIMDGTVEKFSGVQLVTHLQHPSQLAYALQNRQESVLGPLGAQLLARELGIEPQTPVTIQQAERWLKMLRSSEPPSPQHGGTVGAVVLDLEGRLAAATSTGGGSGNTPERMSDSATVAGNYASGFAAISCTGIGEQIVDDGVAVRLETRIRDGKPLKQAADKVYREAERHQRAYGWIALDRHGSWCLYTTTEQMPCAARSGDLDQAICD